VTKLHDSMSVLTKMRKMVLLTTADKFRNIWL